MNWFVILDLASYAVLMIVLLLGSVLLIRLCGLVKAARLYLESKTHRHPPNI